jgi:hypothetical protein
MNQSEAHDELHGSFMTLNEQWAQTRSLWRDGVAAEFERELWDEIVQVTRSLERSAESLYAVLDQALRRTAT